MLSSWRFISINWGFISINWGFISINWGFISINWGFSDSNWFLSSGWSLRGYWLLNSDWGFIRGKLLFICRAVAILTPTQPFDTT